MDFLEWVLVGVLAFVIALGALVFIAAWQDSERPTFELKKADWECVKAEHRTHLQPMLIGKMTIMQPITNTVCLEYRRTAG